MAQAKVPGTFDFIKQLVDQDEKVVVFTSYSEPLNRMEQLLNDSKIKYVRIDGSIDGKEKVDRAFAFNDDPDIMVAICNMKAAGHSINLSAASYVNVLNYPLSPMELDQAIFRTDTVDKKKKTTVYYSTCVGDDGENTVDMRLADLNESKVHDINNFVDKGKDVDDILNATDAIYSEILKQYGNDNSKEE
jgi:SNF2 family DNA or RNA helicase